MGVDTIKIKLWGSAIGYLHQGQNGIVGFQYDKDFLESGIEVSPIKMPLAATTYSFPSLPEETFKGLPGMVADSLPDKFGNIVIKKYLESLGRAEDSLSVIEKLCYTGKRGMGALEYEPNVEFTQTNEKVDIDALTQLAADILSEKEGIKLKHDDTMITQLMQCSSSVGGARAKTLIAWNPETNDIRSGQIDAGAGYEYWLLKFDSIENNRDKDKTPDGNEYTKIEYAYYLMAKQCGIEMTECKLFRENGRSHFMTRRFDRTEGGAKLHMQSLCAMAHMDFNNPRSYSYEDAFSVMRQMKLGHGDFVQLYKRMAFNEFARNFDDHTKNIAFLMNKQGQWSLSPAYDMTFSFKKDSLWVNAHQMLINGKSDGITQEDLLLAAAAAGIKKAEAKQYLEEVKTVVSNWQLFAEEAELSEKETARISEQLHGK